MSATRKGKKQAEEQDFEAFVRETLFKLCKDVEDIKGGQEKMQGDMNLPRSQVSVNEKELKSIRSLTESLSNTLEKLNGDMHAANVKIAKLTESLQERILALEMYSREYNLRFYNVPKTPGENCIDKLETILHKHLDIKPVI